MSRQKKRDAVLNMIQVLQNLAYVLNGPDDDKETVKEGRGDGTLLHSMSHPGSTDGSQNVLHTLNDREEPYGDFGDMAATSQHIKAALSHGKNWDNLAEEQQEAMEMIATKLARILTGNPNHRDSWHDIAGYAMLIEARCPGGGDRHRD